MDTGKMITSIIICIAIISIATAIVYIAGCSIEENFWEKGIKVEEWQNLYLKVVGCTGLFVMLSSIMWVVISYKMPAATADGQSNPRPQWITLTCLSVAECLIIPMVFKFMDYIPHLHVLNILVGCVVLMAAYYVATLFGTPSKFKYAPLGASTFRG